MSSFDDSTSDMSRDHTSEGLVESLRGSADPADQAVAELFRSAKDVFGSGPMPEIGHALARFIGATPAVPDGVAATAESRVRWLPKTAAKVLLGVALATGSLTTAYAAGVVDFGSILEYVVGPVPGPVSEPSVPPTSAPNTTVGIESESVVPQTTEVEQLDPATTVPNSSDGAEPEDPAEAEESSASEEAESELDAGAESNSTVPEPEDVRSVDDEP